MKLYKQTNSWVVLLLLLVSACRPAPESHSFAPGITVYPATTTDRPSAVPQMATESTLPPGHPSMPGTSTAPAGTPDRNRPGTSMPGMVYVPGGLTQIGAADGQEWEKPQIWVAIKPFLLDEQLVTVAEFRRFVEATQYKTQAETFGDAGVLDERTDSPTARQWTLVKGASWQYPQGPDADKASDNHPVTQVSWNDAQAYARWAGKRLPYEFEWEHAARNAINTRERYPFGSELVSTTGKALANTWNGTFPEQDAVTDGFHHTSPVGYYGKTPLGLNDMTGNVWEWCEDWRQSYADVAAGQPPTQPTERVQRGGSFLCEPGWCHGYRVSGRSFTSPETALMHVGFRCAKSNP